MKNVSKFLVLVIFLFSANFFVTHNVLADDYDIYVDADNDDDEDGGEDDPFNTIAEALAEADDGDEIFIKEGDYDENLTIDKEVAIYGDGVGDVTINGVLTIEENVTVEDLTIEGNITIKGNVDATFNNIVVTEADEIAINAYEGSGDVIVKNSVIKKSGTTGFYIQAGRNIVISGCTVYDNEEEGIDLRSNVDGTVSSNTVYDNGESGLEFIVGNSKLTIKNNTFKNNGSSGIAAQYYKSVDEEGNVSIASNTASGNRQ